MKRCSPRLLALLAPLAGLPMLPAQANAPADSLSHLPLAFEENRGQAETDVRFLSRGAGYSLALAANETVLNLIGGKDGREIATLRTRLLGANRAAEARGEAALPGTSNYLHGNKPAEWVTGVQQFGQVRYAQVYPGVDLVYYGQGQQLEYDFRVAAGADASRIGMALDGAQSLRLDGEGNLVVKTAVGELVQHRPVAWQQIDGQRVPVEASFRLHGKQVSFALAAYDRSHELVVDPLLSFHLYLPAIQHEFANASAVDAAGNLYVTGYSIPYGPLNNALVNRFVNRDVFVTKIDASGSRILYSAYIGGSKDDIANAIKVDADGNAYIAGVTSSNDYPTANAAQPAKAGYRDGFVTKLAANGKTIVYSTFLGGVGDDYLASLALAANGEVAVAGASSSIDYPTTAGALRKTNAGSTDAVVSKLAANGALIYSTYLGGSSDDGASGIALDAAGRAYVTGYSYSFNFPVTPTAVQPSRSPLDTYPCGSNTCSSNYSDAFITVLAPAGDALSYSTYLGGIQGGDTGYDIAVNASGSEVAVAGSTQSSDFPLANALQPTFAGTFVAKLAGSPGALGLAYSTFFGGSYSYGTSATAVALDGAGDVYLIGYTYATDLPTKQPYQRANSGGYDGFLAKFKPDGSALVYATYLGGANHDYANGLSVGSNGEVWVSGYTYSTTFTTTKQPIQGSSVGLGDPFAVKFLADGSDLAYATYFGETNNALSLSLGNNNKDQSGLSFDVPIPLRGVVGCTLRAIDGALIANTNILFPNSVPCGTDQPAP